MQDRVGNFLLLKLMDNLRLIKSFGGDGEF
jgi:hypothetical protein